MTKTILNVLVFALVADFFILTIGLAQVAVEGRTGHWNGWWGWQANAVIRLIK